MTGKSKPFTLGCLTIGPVVIPQTTAPTFVPLYPGPHPRAVITGRDTTLCERCPLMSTLAFCASVKLYGLIKCSNGHITDSARIQIKRADVPLVNWAQIRKVNVLPTFGGLLCLKNNVVSTFVHLFLDLAGHLDIYVWLYSFTFMMLLKYIYKIEFFLAVHILYNLLPTCLTGMSLFEVRSTT